MIQPLMPATSFVKTTVHSQFELDLTSTKGLKGLSNIEKVAMVDDNTCCEKVGQLVCPMFSSCCCPRRYRLTNVEKGYGVGDQALYKITETRSCCPNEWTLSDASGQKLSVFSQKCCWFRALSCCFGGPGFDIHEMQNDTKGAYQGSAKVPACQCFNTGYDVTDGSQKIYFVGDVCNCFKKGVVFEPIWNDDESEVLKMNAYVTPCLKRYLPCLCCCLGDHRIVDFPTRANSAQRSELIAGTLMKEVL